MSTSFPNSLDTFPTIVSGPSGTLMTGHAAVHANVHDAIIATQRTALAAGRALTGFFSAPVTGQYYDNNLWGNAPTTLALAASRIDLTPFIPPQNITIDRIGVAVSTGVSGSVRVLVYEADINGRPATNVLETASLSSASAVMIEDTLSFTFVGGRVYWVGTHANAAPSIRAVPLGGAFNLGLLAGNATSYATVIRRTSVALGSAPGTWTYNQAERVASIAPPSVRFRVA